MSVVIALIIGLIVGIVAKFLMPGREPSGFLITALLGISGSVLANFLGSSIGFYNQGDGAGFIASVFGAMIILAVYKAFSGRN